LQAVIGAYGTAYFEKKCTAGVCDAWNEVSLIDPGKMFGGDGSIALSCTTDPAAPQCDVTMTMKGGFGWEYQTFAVCPKVGGAVTKCNGCQSCPSFFKIATDRTTDRMVWLRAGFTRDVVEADEFYFTANNLIARWKWHGQTKGEPYSPPRLVYSELVTYSTPFSDFGTANKANCLSKTTVDAVLKAAADKKGLKNKIILQSGPVQDLIKNAPYKTIDEAILKIKGIGSVNVVYVSFMWNFFC
jgi:hypothetical protein